MCIRDSRIHSYLTTFFDREFNSVRKKVYALKNSFDRTAFFRSFIPGATLLRRFAPGYQYFAHTGLNPQLHSIAVQSFYYELYHTHLNTTKLSRLFSYSCLLYTSDAADEED